VVFEKANVVHMGDLVFNRMYPYVDRPGGATLRGWIKSLEDSAASYPADAIYVFGHGNPKFGVTGKRDDLLGMRDFFSAILERVEKEIAAGHDKPAVVAVDNLPGFPDYHAPLPNRLGMVLGAAFDELTAPKA
jgi:glyoxylase-like metal-dependent hydrolase (beta-lactamase superfamily II)